MAEVTPVTLVIGFPGAGKTKLCEHLACQPGVAVVATQPDAPMRWNAGCPCCAPRDDVARALRTLLPRVRRDEVRRVVIETTGLADPGPFLATLLSDTVAASAYRLDGIVAVADAVHGAAWLDLREAAVGQIASADRIVLSKADLADADDLRARLRQLNPAASIVTALPDAADPPAVFGPGWFDVPGDAIDQTCVGHPDIRTFCLSHDQTLRWEGVRNGLEQLVVMRGASLLRIKGVLHLEDHDRPIAVSGVQHLWQPPLPLPAWPASDPRVSRLMFITRDLPRVMIEAELGIIGLTDGRQTASRTAAG